MKYDSLGRPTPDHSKNGKFLRNQKYEGYEKEIREMVEIQKIQHWKVAEKLGIPVRMISDLCKRYGIKTQRVGPRNGAGHTNWKGGVKIVKGYRYIYSPEHPFRTKSKYVSEHRLVMENKLKRYLHPKEVIHHIDGDSLNNHIDNLVLFSSNADHLKHELTGKIQKWTQKYYNYSEQRNNKNLQQTSNLNQ